MFVSFLLSLTLPLSSLLSPSHFPFIKYSRIGIVIIFTRFDRVQLYLHILFDIELYQSLCGCGEFYLEVHLSANLLRSILFLK